MGEEAVADGFMERKVPCISSRLVRKVMVSGTAEVRFVHDMEFRCLCQVGVYLSWTVRPREQSLPLLGYRESSVPDVICDRSRGA